MIDVLKEVEVTVLRVMGDGACRLVLEVLEAVVAGLGLLTLLDRPRRDEDAIEVEVTVADGTVMLVLPEVVVDVDSPPFDVVLAGEALSTPLEKIRMQARTAMP